MTPSFSVGDLSSSDLGFSTGSLSGLLFDGFVVSPESGSDESRLLGGDELMPFSRSASGFGCSVVVHFAGSSLLLEDEMLELFAASASGFVLSVVVLFSESAPVFDVQRSD